MRKAILTALILFATTTLPHPAMADDKPFWLVLTMRDGSTTAYPYTEKPTITIKNGIFTVTTSAQKVGYPVSAIGRFRLTDSYTAPKVYADVNGDMAVDVADIATVIDVMASNGSEPVPTRTKADVNGDGAVDVADISCIISAMAK